MVREQSERCEHDLSSHHRRRNTIFALIVLMGLAYRVWCAVPTAVIRGDGLTRYDPIARNLIAGRGFSSEKGPPYRPNDFEVPGYPLFLAGVYYVSMGSAKAVIVLQLLLELATLLLIPPIVRALGLNRMVGSIAFACGMMSPFLPSVSREIISETLVIFFVTLLCFLLTKTDQQSRKKDVAIVLSSGVVAAVCVLIRADCYLLVALVGLFVLGTLRGILLSQRAALLGLYGLVILVVLSPWILYNYSTFGVLEIPGQKQYTGSNLNNLNSGYRRWCDTWMDDVKWLEIYYWTPSQDMPTYFPTNKIPDPVERSRAEAALALVKQDRFSTVADQEFNDLAEQATKTRPIRRWVTLPLRRAASSWLRVPNNTQLPGSRRTPWILFIYVIWFAMLSLAAIGCLVGIRRRQYKLLAIGALVASRTVIPLSSAWGLETRYLYEAIPCLFILSGLGLVYSRELLMRFWAGSVGTAVVPNLPIQ